MPPSGPGILGLNPAQREAVEQIDGPVLILAGAGTGKTRVITTRIAYMVANGISPASILAVTFTNKAANEMRERVSGMVEKEEAKKLTISTFHSLCVRILRSGIERLGYKKNFTIYTGSDQIGLIRKIIVRLAAKDENLEPKAAQSLISQAKNRGIPPEATNQSLVADIYRAYQQELKQLNAVDFDDLLILAEQLLDEHAVVRDEWRRRFRYLMVDEFQDTNRLQMSLLRLLVGKERNVCVVGDDDQSIYGWRGAEISNILEFERFFPDPRVVKLEENYRSTRQVLDLANSLIRHGSQRREKTLRTTREGKEGVRVIAMPDADVEAEAVVTEITEAQRMHGKKWEDFAVLFRMNTQTRVFEEQLRKRSVPYRVVGGQSFYERREVKDVLAYLCLLLNQDDDISLLRVINNPPRGIGNPVVAQATDSSIAAKQSIFETLSDLEFLSNLSTRAQNALQKFVDLVDRYSDSAHTESGNYAAMTEALLEEIGFYDYLNRSCKTTDEANNRRQNVKELIEGMYQHRARSSTGLRGFLDNVSLMQDREEKDEEKDAGTGVSLITMHAAKGLEFPWVFLAGFEEGLLPHSRSVEEGSRDEERRLLYVGITRAMEKLTLTYCHSRKRWGEKMPCQVSSFLKEFGEGLFEHVTYEDLASQPASKESAKSYFASLRESLGKG